MYVSVKTCDILLLYALLFNDRVISYNILYRASQKYGYILLTFFRVKKETWKSGNLFRKQHKTFESQLELSPFPRNGIDGYLALKVNTH